MGLADINALIKYRDAHPKAPVKAVFMVFNRPAYAVIARKSRGIAAPKDLAGKRLAPRSAISALRVADLREGQRHRSGQGHHREYRPAAARADAGRRPGRRHHRPFVLILHQSRRQGRAGRGHCRAADGRLRRRSLWQSHHRQQPVRGRAAASRARLLARLPHGPEADGGRAGAAIAVVLKHNDALKKQLEPSGLPW